LPPERDMVFVAVEQVAQWPRTAMERCSKVLKGDIGCCVTPRQCEAG